MLEKFSVKNLKFAKEIWTHEMIMSTGITPDISFVDYVPESHTYKVKPQYLELIKDFIHDKVKKYGVAEKIIESKELGYSITMTSLLNFFTKNHYNEEISNALFVLHYQQASNNRYLLYNTLAYHSIESTLKKGDSSLMSPFINSDLKECKGIILPIIFSNCSTEMIAVMICPNEHEITLLHYGSSTYESPSSREANLIMDNLIEFMDTYAYKTEELLGRNVEEESKIAPQWKKNVRSIKRRPFKPMPIDKNGNITPQLLKKESSIPEDTMTSSRMICNHIIRMCSGRHHFDEEALKTISFLELLFGNTLL